MDEPPAAFIPVTCFILAGELCSPTHFILAEILELTGGAIPPASAVPASTRVSPRMKRVQEHSSPVKVITPLAWLQLGAITRF